MVLQLFLANLIVGLVSFSFANVFFAKFSDKGYAVGHLLGWLCVSYISFLLSHLGIPVYYSMYVAFTIWLVLNLALEWKHKSLRIGLTLKNVVISQSIFLAFAIFLYFARIGSFTLSTIERTPDFAIIMSLFNTNTLPPVDVWLAGKPINYYYFGHYVAFMIMSLAKLEPIAGFFYLVMWMFGMYALCLFRFGESLYHFTTSTISKQTKFGKVAPSIAGLLSVFLVLLAGNLYSAKYLWLPDFSFWLPTRFVPGTIMELPLFSFFIADLHGHMWGMALGILVLFTLLAFWFDDRKPLLSKNFFIYLLAFLLGLSVIANTWDVLSLGLLVGLAVLIRYAKNLHSSKDILAIIYNIVIVVAVPFVWLMYYRQEGDGGIGLTHGGSGLWNLFLQWGGFAIPLVVLLLAYPRKLLSKINFFWLISLVSILLILFTEFFFIKDIMQGGEFKRANTVFKIYMQVWLWLGAIAGPVIVLLVKPVDQVVKKHFEGKTITIRFFTTVTLLALVVYPYLTLKQNIVPRYDRGVYAGMAFFYNYLSADYKAFLFLKNIQNGLPRGQKQKIIVEAPGESFQNQSLFSSYLGWPTLLGWSGHVWTYRGTYKYSDERGKELTEIYTGTDLAKTQAILDKYKVDYIIVGTLEKLKYPSLNAKKLLSLGTKIFDRDGVVIIAYQLVPQATDR